MPDLPNSGRGRQPQGPMVVATTKDGAALLLVESLLHGLVKRSILSLQDAIEIVDIAVDIERDLDPSGLDPPFGDFKSQLASIAHSLRIDLDE